MTRQSWRLTVAFTAVRTWRCCTSSRLMPKWQTPISENEIPGLPMRIDIKKEAGKKGQDVPATPDSLPPRTSPLQVTRVTASARPANVCTGAAAMSSPRGCARLASRGRNQPVCPVPSGNNDCAIRKEPRSGRSPFLMAARKRPRTHASRR